MTYAIRIFIFFFFNFFSTFPFSPFQWLTFYCTCFQFKIFWERVIETGKFYHRVATCSRGQFCFKFFSHISEHFVHTVFQAPLSKSLWSGYHWNGQMKLLGENWRHANYRNTVIFFFGEGGGEANVVSWRGEGVTVVSCRLVHHSYSMLKGQAPKNGFLCTLPNPTKLFWTILTLPSSASLFSGWSVVLDWLWFPLNCLLSLLDLISNSLIFVNWRLHTIL